MREIQIDRDKDGDGEIRRYLEDFAAGFERGPVGTEEFSDGVTERRRQRGLAGDDLAGPFPARAVGEARAARPAPAKQPAFAWPFGVAAGVLFEVVPGSERNAGGLAGTVVRGVRIATQAEVRDEPRSSWPADLVEWVSLDGLVGLEPKEALAWLELADQWAAEERGTGGKRKIEPDVLEAIRTGALSVILEERKRSRRKRKAAAMREIGGAE